MHSVTNNSRKSQIKNRGTKSDGTRRVQFVNDNRDEIISFQKNEHESNTNKLQKKSEKDGINSRINPTSNAIASKRLQELFFPATKPFDPSKTYKFIINSENMNTLLLLKIQKDRMQLMPCTFNNRTKTYQCQQRVFTIDLNVSDDFYAETIRRFLALDPDFWRETLNDFSTFFPGLEYNNSKTKIEYIDY